jgi:hypothetical protein
MVDVTDSFKYYFGATLLRIYAALDILSSFYLEKEGLFKLSKREGRAFTTRFLRCLLQRRRAQTDRSIPGTLFNSLNS